MSNKARIVGWSHIAFGKLVDPDTEALMARVSLDALRHAGIGSEAVDGIYVGVSNNGFQKQDFHAGLVALADERLAHTPATRLENACATGSAALYAAVDFVESGRGRIALVIGAEKMTSRSNAEIGDILLGASYRKEEAGTPGGFAGVFAKITQAYFERYGDHSEDLALIAAKNHRNGVDNPYAQLRKDLGEEFCRSVSDKNPMVADPLRRTDCSPVSDGAAAVVLSVSPTAGATAPVRLAGFGQANDFFPADRRDPTAFSATRASWQRALGMAGVGLEELDFAEVHDCFTIAELLMYEAMGLTEPGHGARAVEEGWVFKDGKLPINVSGGLKAKGHPVGAIGVSQHVIAAMQLTGTAGAMQLANPRRAAVQNMGGVGIANYVSVLEAV